MTHLGIGRIEIDHEAFISEFAGRVGCYASWGCGQRRPAITWIGVTLDIVTSKYVSGGIHHRKAT
jgi:hypothetical protein